MTPQPSIDYSSKILNRYTDAYRAATAVVWLGNGVKTLGILLAAAVVFVYLEIFTRGNAGLLGFGTLNGQLTQVAAVIIAGLVFLAFWVVGVFITAHGQLLRASVDACVNTSPFLADGQRAQVMSLT